MESAIKFDAPLGLSLKLMTVFSVFVLVGISVLGLCVGPTGNVAWIVSMVIIPLLILVIAVFFMIRGYIVTPQKLLVQRLCWNDELHLKNLLSVEFDPEAMKRSFRTFGNGGLFCFAGKFYNKKLGSYRAFATAPDLAVVLKFTDRIIVVTPDNPEAFVNALQRLVSNLA